ncbi:recombinase family protein [Streptomyces collinus]|uniref:recombinase family protein n=1 Tax=Streptomyces collinus TaxID=42684 RepID=UPI0033C44099
MPAVRQSRAMAAPSTPTAPIHASISCGHSPTRTQACARPAQVHCRAAEQGEGQGLKRATVVEAGRWGSPGAPSMRAGPSPQRTAPSTSPTPTGRTMFQMQGAFAELEREMIRQRTREGLAEKRAQGVRLGRPATLPVDVVARIV